MATNKNKHTSEAIKIYKKQKKKHKYTKNILLINSNKDIFN